MQGAPVIGGNQRLEYAPIEHLASIAYNHFRINIGISHDQEGVISVHTRLESGATCTAPVSVQLDTRVGTYHIFVPSNRVGERAATYRAVPPFRRQIFVPARGGGAVQIQRACVAARIHGQPFSESEPEGEDDPGRRQRRRIE
jgi:hypothetical protein